MTDQVVTARSDESVETALERMREAKLRMLPVVDADNKIVGAVSTISIVAHLLPEYVASGDLKSISYAPDLGILRQHYQKNIQLSVAEVMNSKPLIIRPDDSLLSVSAELNTPECHGYALVADQDNRLVGVLSSGDILDRLRQLHSGDDFDA